uniref:Uncharacterized protein n=1 Tax=Branchiostoma floridae TaxID=7739 RepID=C3Z249_BRAFL|eukprot:XP_002597088.1 hypothetical protein BRAFLDRAFT_105038 [Branchiostoma floridae]
MGKSRYTIWLETAEPLAFENTTCTATSETGSHTAVFMASERADSSITIHQATELSLMNTTPFSTIISTTLPLTNISTTPLSTSASDDGYKDLMRYIRSAAIGLLSPLALLGVWGCGMYIWRRLRRKAPGNPSGPSRNGNQITACSRWPVGDQGNMDESVISPYAEGGFDDHDSLNDSESVISPYAEGGFADHPDLRRADSSQSETVPYGEAKLCAAYAGRARAQTHPVPSRPYSTERPRQTPNREGAILAAYGPNGRDKSGKKCYQHPSILPNPAATQSSAYQQNASVDKCSRKAPCYNSPAQATDQERTLSSTYDQNDPREAAKGSRKAPCYNSQAFATDRERTLSSTYDQNDPREAAKGSRKAPCYNSPALTADQENTLSSTYDQNDRSELLVSRIDAGSWQSCREVSVAKCGVGDSRSDGHEYRYDIGAYRYKWTKYPREAYSYNGPFVTVALSQVYQSCQVCSNETMPTQGGPTQNPSLPPFRTNIMIVDNDVGELDTQKAEVLSQIPCGRYCRLWFVGCNLTDIEGGAFAKLPQVSTLVIWRSNVQTLRNGTFAGMEGLKKLLLFENNLTHLEAIKSVEYVHAVENKLTAIGAGMFHGLERLLVLNLEGNRISHIAAGAFSTNTKLSNLDLARNRLTFLSGGWFRSTFPYSLMARGNAIAVVALEDRALRSKRITLDNPPRCTCANDQLYEHQGNNLKFKQRFISAIRVLSTTSCPASALYLNSPAPVNPISLPCPAPLVVIVHVERSAAYKYEAVGDVYWEQSPIVSFAFPNGLHHEVDMTYDTNTTTHDSLPTGNLTVRVVTDLKAEGWVKCEGPQNVLGESGNDSLCSNYMGRSRFTLWLETAEPLAFENTTCTATSATGSHTAVFMESERAHSGITTPQATELSLMNTTPFSTIISTTLPLTINTTPLSTSASDDGIADILWYIVYVAPFGYLPLAVLVVRKCVVYIWRRLRRKAPGNPSGDQGNMDESVISPYAEGGFDDHDSLNDSESVISPYAEGGFADHPDLRRADSSQSETVPYGEAKLCAAYAGRARAQTHPVPSRPYSTERPRQTPNREGAILAAYGPNGRDKSGKKCYQHPSILPNPAATQSSAYQQNASVDKCSRKAPCYNSPAQATDQERTLSSTYDQNDPREAAKGSRKAPCYNSQAFATDRERTLSSTYDQNDPREAAKGSRKAPCYNSPALTADQENTLSSTYDQNDRSEVVCNFTPTSPSSESGTQSAIYDENHRRGPATGRGNSYICPSPAASADRSPAAAYSQNDHREAINDTPDSPETNSYEPAHCEIQ